MIMRHEEIHIHLRHLWFYAFWDVLKIVFWFNPLIYICLPYFKRDMEDICDRVVIQKSGCKPYAYGKLLLKSMQLLAGNEASNSFDMMNEMSDINKTIEKSRKEIGTDDEEKTEKGARGISEPGIKGEKPLERVGKPENSEVSQTETQGNSAQPQTSGNQTKGKSVNVKLF